MSDFFTYEILKTSTGAIAATIITVHFLKDIKYLQNIPVRWLTVVVAECIVILPNMLTENFYINDLLLYILNGLLVAVSAIGGLRLKKRFAPDNQSLKISSGTNDYHKGSI
ncbi:MAG: hypothetical protein GX922_00940 [Firmicutes bacterium]|jgi:hypothetical protein|nr:hypothetical protein [Bacillota bacterium]